MLKSRATVERSTTAWPQRSRSLKVKEQRVKEGADRPQAGQARSVKGNTAEQPIMHRSVRVSPERAELKSVLLFVIPQSELAVA